MSELPPQPRPASEVDPPSDTWAVPPGQTIARSDVPFAEAPPPASSTIGWIGATIGVGIAIGVLLALQIFGQLRDESCRGGFFSHALETMVMEYLVLVVVGVLALLMLIPKSSRRGGQTLLLGAFSTAVTLWAVVSVGTPC